jgi:hypothetical protein
MSVLCNSLVFCCYSSLLHTHLSLPHEVCNSPDQAAHYHTLSPKLWTSSLSWRLDDLEVNVVLFLLFMQFPFSRPGNLYNHHCEYVLFSHGCFTEVLQLTVSLVICYLNGNMNKAADYLFDVGYVLFYITISS